MAQDPVAVRLLRAPITPQVRADVWDAFHAAKDEDDLAERLTALQIPDAVKADLWDMKMGGGTPPMAAEQPQAPPPAPRHPMARFGDAVTDALPMIGGTIGGVIGGVAGSIPGAAAGAAIGGSGGEASKQLLNRMQGRAAPGSPMEAATDIATQGAIQGGLEVAGGALTKGVGAAGKAIYRGYMKPSLAGTELAKARDIVKTALNEALPISKAGEERGARIIKEINAEVEAELKGAAGKVDLHKIAERVRSFAQRKYHGPGSPEVDYAAAMKVADEIDRHPSLGMGANARPTRVEVSALEANRTKQRLDNAAGDTAFGVERGAATEARKVGRHAARESIERVVPKVAPLNAREAKLIDAVEAVAKATGREENKNWFYGVPSMLAVGAGAGAGAYSQDPGVSIITTLGIRGVLAPAVATRAAILAFKFGKVRGTSAAMAARMGAILALRESEQEREPTKGGK